MINKTFLTRLLKKELCGEQSSDKDTRRSIQKKVAIITVLFSLMCVENIFRVLDFIYGWSNPIESEESIRLQQLGPRAVGQVVMCFLVMLINNIMWLYRKGVTPGWHTLHYFVAAIALIMYMPRPEWWPVMTDQKYALTLLSIFVFQIGLGISLSLTTTHFTLAILATLVN